MYFGFAQPCRPRLSHSTVLHPSTAQTQRDAPEKVEHQRTCASLPFASSNHRLYSSLNHHLGPLLSTLCHLVSPICSQAAHRRTRLSIHNLSTTSHSSSPQPHSSKKVERYAKCCTTATTAARQDPTRLEATTKACNLALTQRSRSVLVFRVARL